MRLSDILSAGGGGDIGDLWDSTEAAGEMGPLPPGEYIAHIVGGELESSRTNATPGYKLTFKVIEGDYAGRLFWLDCWLTAAAMPQTKRDLHKLGVTSLSQLERPLPQWIRCRCKLALRKDDNGDERNRVKSFEVVGVDAPEPNPFPPGAVANPSTKPNPQLPAAMKSEGGDDDLF